MLETSIIIALHGDYTIHNQIFLTLHLSMSIQVLRDSKLVLIVLAFVAIDVIVLLVYTIYNLLQDTILAIPIRNRETVQEVIGVSDHSQNLIAL